MSLHDTAIKSYHLVLKSHCEAPDFEAEVDAFSEDEAVKAFQQRVDADAETIKANMEVWA